MALFDEVAGQCPNTTSLPIFLKRNSFDGLLLGHLASDWLLFITRFLIKCDDIEQISQTNTIFHINLKSPKVP